MAKRLTDIQKKEIIKSFKRGKTVESLSKEFNFNKLTIVRNLKKSLGELNYKKFLEKHKSPNQISSNKDLENDFDKSKSKGKFDKNNIDSQFETELLPTSNFFEIVPLDCNIDNSSRKEISSVSIQEIEFPKIVYMLVDKNVELEIKLLKDYPEWEFLPNEDLNRKTIEIFFDLKKARRVCSKEQKVIKVPNTDVFRIVSPILISRGISRIVSDEKLIAL